MIVGIFTHHRPITIFQLSNIYFGLNYIYELYNYTAHSLNVNSKEIKKLPTLVVIFNNLFQFSFTLFFLYIYFQCISPLVSFSRCLQSQLTRCFIFSLSPQPQVPVFPFIIACDLRHEGLTFPHPSTTQFNHGKLILLSCSIDTGSLPRFQYASVNRNLYYRLPRQ